MKIGSNVIAVIGLGKFGFYIAKSLSQLDITVIAVDSDESKVQEISKYVENAFILNSTSKVALEEVGVYNLDTVIVSIGENIEASILTVMALKDLNNKNIIAKAINPTHGQILTKLGAYKVIYPEEIAGKILLKQLIENIKTEEIEIDETIKMLKISADESIANKNIKTIESLNPKLKIICIKNETGYEMCINPDYLVKNGDLLVFLGETKEIQEFQRNILK